MKYIFILLFVLLITNNTHANFERLEQWVINAGKMIEAVDNVPLIGKLTNLLPFTVAASCLQRCPIQTMIVLGGFLFYTLSRNKVIYFAGREFITKKNKIEHEAMQFDDTLFDFEEEDDESTGEFKTHDSVDRQIFM